MKSVLTYSALLSLASTSPIVGEPVWTHPTIKKLDLETDFRNYLRTVLDDFNDKFLIDSEDQFENYATLETI